MGAIHKVKRETVTESRSLYIYIFFLYIFFFFFHISFFSRKIVATGGENIFRVNIAVKCEIRGVFIPSNIAFEIPQVFILLAV